MADSNQIDQQKLEQLMGVHGGLVDSTFRNLGHEPPSKEELLNAVKKAAGGGS